MSPSPSLPLPGQAPRVTPRTRTPGRGEARRGAGRGAAGAQEATGHLAPGARRAEQAEPILGAGAPQGLEYSQRRPQLSLRSLRPESAPKVATEWLGAACGRRAARVQRGGGHGMATGWLGAAAWGSLGPAGDPRMARRQPRGDSAQPAASGPAGDPSPARRQP